MLGIVFMSVYLGESTDTVTMELILIRDEIRVMLQFTCCGLIIVICPLEFPYSERQLAQ